MNILQLKTLKTINLLKRHHRNITEKRYELFLYNKEICSDCSNHLCQHTTCQERIAYTQKIDKILKNLQDAIKQAEEEIRELWSDNYNMPL